jgi:CubicO group peptidase (beta-lactamase class C family)
MLARRFLVGLVLVACGALVAATSIASPPASGQRSRQSTNRRAASRGETLAGPITGWLKDAIVPGMAIAVIEDGRLAWQAAFGVKDADSKSPVTEDTIFEAASLSKPVFAYAVMKLVDRGVIALDTPLAEYLAGADLKEVYPPAATGDPRWKAITARMVLSHRTGFPNWFNNAPMRFLFDPGQRFSYSGEGYSLLAAAVTTAAKRPFNELLRDLVFEPLAMKASSYVWRPDYEGRFTSGHDLLGRPAPRSRASRPLPGASLYTTAGDYARFLVALGEGTGLAKTTWAEMTRAQAEVLGRDDQPCFSWGLGVGVYRAGPETVLWHWGDNGNLNAYFEILPRQRKGVVFFLNGQNAHAVTPLVVRRVLGVQTPAIATSYFRYPAMDSPAMAITRAFVAGGARAAAKAAAEALRGAVAEDPAATERLATLAAIAMQQGDLAGARAAADAGLERQPTAASLLVVSGGLHAVAGDRAAMETAFGRARDATPDVEGRINSLGYTLLRGGRVDEAIAVFEYNVKAYPQSANVYDSLAEAFEKKGEPEKAIRHYARAVSIDPAPGSSSSLALTRLLRDAGPTSGAEDVVRALYRRVSFEAGRNVDWEQVKALFVPEAVIVLRTSRTAMTVFDRDGFVKDFLRFIADAKLEDRAFEETILAIRTEETGEVARATVRYAARIPSDGRPAQEGVDVFLLMKRDGSWRIVSIVNEIVRPGVPVPDEVRR